MGTVMGCCSPEGESGGDDRTNLPTSFDGGVVHLEMERQFHDSIRNSPLVVAKFYAPWCGPCRQLGPAFDQLHVDHKAKGKFFAVDVDQFEQLAEDEEIGSIPCIKIYRNGLPIGSHIGAEAAVRAREQLRR